MNPPPFETAAELSAIPNLRHGFFGRRDGMGHDFNMSPNFGTPESATANLNLAAQTMGGKAMPVARLKQTHSNKVITLTDTTDMEARPEADGMVTAMQGVILSILTADCAPLLFVDPQSNVIGACHAGWQGAVSGIIEATIAGMVKLGANPGNIVSAIGPTISGANYEVGPEFSANLEANNPEAYRFIFMPEGKTRAHFDLPAFAGDRVQHAGAPAPIQVGDCTLAQPDIYFSHRHASAGLSVPGRQVSMIALA